MTYAREEFLDSQDLIEGMVNRFKVADFNPVIASSMVYDETT
jgi:hypothetical protein